MTAAPWRRRALPAVAAGALLLAPWPASGQPPDPAEVIRPHRLDDRRDRFRVSYAF